MGVFDEIKDFFEGVGDFLGDLAGDIFGFLFDIPSASDLESKYGGTLINQDGATNKIPVVYGVRKVGILRGLPETPTTGKNNTNLWYVGVLSEGEIESIDDILIDDVSIADSKFSDQVVGPAPISLASDPTIAIAQYMGTETQTADQNFINAGIGWTAQKAAPGVAYLAIRLKWDSDVFSRFPQITAIVRGKRVWNGDTDTVEWSDNPVWCLWDYLTNTRYGKGLDEGQLNLASFQAASLIVQNSVAKYAGASSTEPALQCNTRIDTSVNVFQNVKTMLSNMRGYLPYAEGQYHLAIETNNDVTFAVTPSQIIGGIKFHGVRKKDRFNRVTAKFINAENEFTADEVTWPQETDAEYSSFLAEDGGTELATEIDLDCINDYYASRDMARVHCLRSRYGFQISFLATSELLEVRVGDVITVPSDTYGWEDRPFRVLRRTPNAKLEVGLICMAHDPGIYPWVPLAEQYFYPVTNLPDPFQLDPPEGIAVAEEIYETRDGAAAKARILISWEQDEGQVASYEVQAMGPDQSEYFPVPSDQSNNAKIDDVVAGQWAIRIRSISLIGAASEWASVTPSISGLAGTPSDPAELNIQAVSSIGILRWPLSPDIDVRIGGGVVIRHTSLPVAQATWEGSRFLDEVPGKDTENARALIPGTYMIKYRDSSGTYSDGFAAVETAGAVLFNYSSVGLLIEDPGFLGGGTNVEVVSNVLQLTDTAQNGTYDFVSGIDAGSVQGQRFLMNVVMSVISSSDLIDSRADYIDSWDDFDGGGAGEGNAQPYIRVTDDDPAGLPAWSGWQPFDGLTEFECRAAEFRLEISVADPSNNIQITALDVSSQTL